MKSLVCCSCSIRDSRTRRAARSTAPHARSSDRRFFRGVVEQLKIHLPPRRPVVVLNCRQMATRDGDCVLKDGRFQIRVSRELIESHAVDVLLHEWAHALSWDNMVDKASKSRTVTEYDFERIAHGPKWGIAYSKVYRTFFTEIMLQMQAQHLNAALFNRMGGR